tara:strand:+ start:260 stop:532 length:273 start_codon:yes stop_codon:yes gene_type:complete
MTYWYIYIIRCRNNSLYTGISTDVKRRFKEHSSDPKKGAKYLRGKGPLKLEWKQKVKDKSLAAKIEYHIKTLPKATKEDIIKKKRKIKLT